MKKTDVKRLFISFIILLSLIILIMKINVQNDTKAILISIISILYGFIKDFIDSFHQKKHNRKSFMADFFKEIYFKKIVSDIPSVLSKYTTVNVAKKSDILSHLESLIIDIMDSSMFYKYHDIEFYEKIKNVVINVQDDIFKVKENISNNNYRIGITDRNLNKNISELYDIMLEYYLV